MEQLAIITLVFIGMGAFVWLCTLRGDQQWREREHAELPAPEWARLLFILFIGGLLTICLAPGIASGILNATR